jgi:hypothetical protein
MNKLAVKKLNPQDLSFFRRGVAPIDSRPSGIKLEREVFVEKLFPGLPKTDVGRFGRGPLNLFVFGPGLEPELNLQRKIVKRGSLNGWMLGEERIQGPAESRSRFDLLAPNDYVVFDFEGDLFPHTARAVLVAAGNAEDARLHSALNAANLGRMAPINLRALARIVRSSSIPEQHPIHELLLDAELEDAVRGGIEGTRRLLSRRSGRRLSKAELKQARQNADDVGQLGDEFVGGHLSMLQAATQITSYEWVSSENAISPFDFTVQFTGDSLRKIDVKSTRGDFSQIIHVSIGQLFEMRDGAEEFDIYRVYALDERTAKLRIAAGVRAFAAQILAEFERLPAGITVDGVSIRPDVLAFGDEIIVDLSSIDDLPA